MIFISHRGNLSGSQSDLENQPDYIENALKSGYEVEIDLWYINNRLFLGHDQADYEINLNWLVDRKDKLWIHCKDYNSIIYLLDQNQDFNFFWHQEDKLTLTSKKYIWVYPGNQPIKNSIAVMPEIFGDDCTDCLGICSDFVERYKIIFSE